MESENAGPRAESPGPRAAIYPKGEVSGPPSPSLDSIEGRRLVFSLPPLSLHRSLEGKHPRLWTSLSSVGIPCLLPPPHPIPGRRASGGRLYESRPGPGVDEGSAASPWAPSLLLPAPRRLLAQPDTAQQSRILHHQFDWVRVPLEPEPGPEAQGRATWGTSIWAGSSLGGGGPGAREASGRVPRAGAAQWGGEVGEAGTG